MAKEEFGFIGRATAGHSHSVVRSQPMGQMASSISTKAEVKAAADEPGAIFLDVRREDEVKEASLTSKPFKHVSCTLEDCTELTATAEQLLPDKNAPVIIFCRSGRRAVKAKEVLEEKGYKKVLNAGGLNDISSYW